MWLVVVRVCGVLIAVLCVAASIRWHERFLQVARKFWLEPTSPVNVALLRIVIFYLLMRSAIGQNPVWYAGMPTEERDLPWGWGWLGSLPFEEGLIAGAEYALIVSAALAMLGVFTRVTAPVAALLAVYVFGVPNFFAKINHGHHARVLCALAIAFSPSGDALSLDRLWKRLRGHPAPAPSSAYTVPVRFSWLLVGTTYFFPGFWKLWEGGNDWISGAKLKFELYKKWASLPDFEPLYRIDRHDWLLAVLGTATLVFEIGFIFSLVNRWTRTVAVFAAMGFHIGISRIMGITFNPFFPLLILIEIERWPAIRRSVPDAVTRAVSGWRDRIAEWWDARSRRLRAASPPASWPLRALWPALVAGSLLFGGQVLAGFTKLNSWPISVYPVFGGPAKRPPLKGSTLHVFLESEGKKPVDMRAKLRRMGSARLKHLLGELDEKVARSKGKDGDRSVLALFRHAGIFVEVDDRVIIYEDTWNVLPPGKRSNYRRRATRRYLVTGSGTLIVDRQSL